MSKKYSIVPAIAILVIVATIAVSHLPIAAQNHSSTPVDSHQGNDADESRHENKRIPQIQDPVRANATAATTPQFVSAESDSTDTSDDVIYNDQFVIARFAFHNHECRLVVTQQFFKDFGALNQIPETANQRFRNYQFYLNPSVTVTRRELTRALADRVMIREASADRPAQFLMKFRVSLITDGLRAAAASMVNQLHPGANLSASNISLFPYRHVVVSANFGAGPVTVASLPTLNLSADPGENRRVVVSALSSSPLDIEARVIADDETLSSFVADPRMTGEFISTGFEVQQDTVSFYMDTMVKLGFHQFLTGDAKWHELMKYQKPTSFLGIPVAPGHIDFTASNWVTRDQLRQFSTIVSSHVGGLIWTTSSRDEANDQIAAQLMNNLLQMSSKEETFDIVERDTEFVLDPELQESLGPDRYEALNAQVKTLIKDKSGDEEETNANDVTWGASGSRIVPKSIRVFQFNRSSFQMGGTRGVVTARAKSAQRTHAIESSIGPFGVELTVSLFQFYNVDDDDEDFDNFGCEFQFFDEHGRVIPGTDWKLERGATGFVGDHHREGSLGRLAPEGFDAQYATNFFYTGNVKSITARVSKIKVKIWANSQDRPSYWKPFEYEFEPADNGDFHIQGGAENGTTDGAYCGRLLKLILHTRDL